MSKEEIESAHKKALKSLEGEKRAALKKAKGMKGKKGKEALAAAEAEFATKLKALEDSYQEKLASLAVGSLEISDKAEEPPMEEPAEVVDEEAAARERKREKARKKKERQKEKEAERERQIEEENANAGPSYRKIELEQIQANLTPLKLKVDEVAADGHCLYRAVAAQTGKNYMEIRKSIFASISWYQRLGNERRVIVWSIAVDIFSRTLFFVFFLGLLLQAHYVQTLYQSTRMNLHPFANIQMKLRRLMNTWARYEIVPNGEAIWSCGPWESP